MTTTSPATAPRPAEPPGGPARDCSERRAQTGTVVLTSLAFLMVTLDALVVVTALPAIRSSIGGTPSGLQWIVNAYNLTFAAAIVTGAALGDRFGRKRIFLVGLGVFTAASIACALAPTLPVLVTFRALQGLGGAILAPVGLTLITEAFPPARRGAAIGLWGGISGLGVAAGPLLGGAVTQGLDWHWVFWINVPVGLGTLAGCSLLLGETHGVRRALDLPGMVLAAAALAVGVDAVTQAPTAGWGSTHTLTQLALATACLAGFVARETRTTAPMIPLGLFRSRSFAAANITQTCSAGAIFSAAYLVSEYFQIGRGDSPLGTGLRFLPWTLTPLLVAPLAGAVSDRFGTRALAVPGLVMQALGFAIIVVLAGGDHPWAAYVAPFIVAGVGVSLAIPTLPAAALGAVTPQQVGAAAGVVNTMQRVGAVLGIAAVTAVFAAHGTLASSAGVVHGFRWGLSVSAAISLIGAITGLAMAGRRPTPVEG